MWGGQVREKSLSPEQEAEIKGTLQALDNSKSDIPDPDPKKAEGEVPQPQADASPAKIHKTIPIDQSLAKHKRNHKPKKAKPLAKEIQKNERIREHGRDTGDAGDGPGSRGGIIFPIDFFTRR